MKTAGRLIQLFVCLAIIGLGPWNCADLWAQRVLSGAELENGCQTYADKAVKLANEWENLQCQKKLNVSPQIFDTDREYHYKRCKNSVGTSIASDLQLMENELKPCRGISDQPGGQRGRPDQPDPRDRPRDIPRRDPPGSDFGNSNGEIWDVTVINSADLARSYHTFRIPTLNGMFTAKNMNPAGGVDFKGQLNGSVFEGLMTDNTGYRATLIGHRTASGDIEGTGCDNRNRSYSFLMKRK
jgi:hypothetical protein